ncbi:MAG: methylated-DNA--[protein]-cysteine S-methyltransferase [Candidatus Nanohaloarchaea archaeon]|nr:methylated-DNA--[protein]-cysteine S-methyltransferase [Candidatus Nanohaloarchaea archaeon]
MEIEFEPGNIRIEDGRVQGEVEKQLESYFDGNNVEFSHEVDISDYSPFNRKVLQVLREIPYGETRTYGEIAREIGEGGSARAVGQAANQNPVPIIIPCHRAVKKDGIGGYRFGKDVKKELLRLEGAEF